VRTGQLLLWRVIRAHLRESDIMERDTCEMDITEMDIRKRDIQERDIRERDIGERDIRERDIWEMDIGETFATCRFVEYLLIHIDIRGVSGSLIFSQSCRRCARFLLRQKPQKLQPTECMSLRSS
jgi:hypothetical protein